MIDGANGVSRASRESFPLAGWSLAVTAVAIVAFLGLRRRWGRLALGGLLLVGGVAGSIQVLALRADAPLARPGAARPVAESVEALRAAVPWPSPIEVRHEDDDVTFPLGRYAVPTRARSAPLGLEVRGTKLPLDCRSDEALTRCEGRP